MSELFDRFAVDRVPRWPLMSRLAALSVVLHGAFLVGVAYVPTLRGLLHVAGTVSGFEFVSEDYDRSLVGQRATIVKLDPHEPLYYPPDYFGAPEVAETTLDPMLVQPAAPPPPPMTVYRPRRQRATPVSTPEPTPEEVAGATPTPTPDAAAGDEAQKQADAELDKIAEQNGVKRPPRINTQPFEDIAVKGKTLVDEGKLNLKTSTLDVSVTAERNDDGTLKDGYRIDGLAGDATMSALAADIVTALSASKVLGIIDARTVNLGLKLDEQNVSIRIVGEMASDSDATRMATGYGVLLAVARNRKQGTREGELYKNLKVVNEGKQFVMTFEMPKEAAGKVISDLLAEKAAKAAAAATPTPSKS